MGVMPKYRIRLLEGKSTATKAEMHICRMPLCMS